MFRERPQMPMDRVHMPLAAIHPAVTRPATTRLHWAHLPMYFYRRTRHHQIMHIIMECLDIPAGSWLHLSGRKRKQTERTPGTPGLLPSHQPAQRPWPDMQATQFQSHKSPLSTATLEACRADSVIKTRPVSSPMHLQRQTYVESSNGFLYIFARPITRIWRRFAGCSSSHLDGLGAIRRCNTRTGRLARGHTSHHGRTRMVSFCTKLGRKELETSSMSPRSRNGLCTHAHLTNFYDSRLHYSRR
jgi:hypothetical protein